MWSNTRLCVYSTLQAVGNRIFSGGCACSVDLKKKLWSLHYWYFQWQPFIKWFAPFNILGLIPSVSVWKGLIQCSWIKRERKTAPDYPGAFSSLDVLLTRLASLYYREMNGQSEYFLINLASSYLGSACEKTLHGPWVAYGQKCTQWQKKPDQVWNNIHTWARTITISWVIVNITGNN